MALWQPGGGVVDGAVDDGFEPAFRALYPRAVIVARRILGDQASAEEVAAEALTRTYVRWRKVRDLEHRDAWVLRVACNCALDAARRRTREDRRRAPASAEVRDAGVADGGDALAVRSALVAALGALPRRQRDAIALRYLGDLAEADVAAAMGVSAGTVKTHLHRGTEALRRSLGPTFDGWGAAPGPEEA